MSDATLDVPPPAGSPRLTRRTVRAPRDLAAGLMLVAVALFVFWAGRKLEFGELRDVGPGFMPVVVAVLIAAFGAGIALSAFLKDGEQLERWRWRGPVFVCAAILLFGATIRTVGLALAGPLVMVVGGLASPDARWKELVIFAVAVTAVCIVLFRYALGLAIPILTIPGVLTI